MTRAVWIEAALNGPWGRSVQPHMPITADEIVDAALASADAGAAIIHFHAYDPDTGRQRDAYELYAPVCERIRAARDVILYPTLPLAGSPDAPRPMSAAERFAAVDKLARAGLIDWSVVDPGSTHIARLKDLGSGTEGFTYLNPEAHIRHGLALGQSHGIVPSYAVYEPGFLRLGAALHAAYPGAPTPIYRFMFSDGLSFGFPPQAFALDAYLTLLDATHPGAPWMVAGLDVDARPLWDMTLARGGHLRVGLEDAPFGTDATNAAMTGHAVARVAAAGLRPATPAEIRAATA
jgi:uncharacterized protein (DUF849 family)